MKKSMNHELLNANIYFGHIVTNSGNENSLKYSDAINLDK